MGKVSKSKKLGKIRKEMDEKMRRNLEFQQKRKKAAKAAKD